MILNLSQEQHRPVELGNEALYVTRQERNRRGEREKMKDEKERGGLVTKMKDSELRWMEVLGN